MFLNEKECVLAVMDALCIVMPNCTVNSVAPVFAQIQFGAMRVRDDQPALYQAYDAYLYVHVMYPEAHKTWPPAVVLMDYILKHGPEIPA